MPLGTSAFLISENRLEAPLTKIPWLLVQKLVPGCGEDREKAPGQASDSSRKRTAHNFHGEEVNSDRATKAGRGKPPFFLFPLLWVEATALSKNTQEVMQESTGGHSARPRWLLSMELPAVRASTHLPLFCGRLLLKFHGGLHDMSNLENTRWGFRCQAQQSRRETPTPHSSWPPALLVPVPAPECGLWTPVSL